MFYVETEAKVPSLPAGRPLRTGGSGRKISIYGLDDGVARPLTPGIRHELLEVPPIRHKAEFDQGRGHVGSFQDPKAGRFQRLFVQPNRAFEFAYDRPSEMG